MDLKNKKCVPCTKGSAPISTPEIEKYLSNLSGWKVNLQGEIEKEFKFKNFLKSLEFVNRVGLIAESEKHHPDIEFGWGYCKIRLITHSIGSLHQNDFIVAEKIEDINE